jgi:hypothetical protein
MKKTFFLTNFYDIEDSTKATLVTIQGVQYWVFKHDGQVRVFTKCGHGRPLKNAKVNNGEIFCCQPYSFYNGTYLGCDSRCKNLEMVELLIENNNVFIVHDENISLTIGQNNL